MDVIKTYTFNHRVWCLRGPKPYDCILFCDIHGPKPKIGLWFGVMDVTKSNQFKGSGDIHGLRPYKFAGSAESHGPNPKICLWFGAVDVTKTNESAEAPGLRVCRRPNDRIDGA